MTDPDDTVLDDDALAAASGGGDEGERALSPVEQGILDDLGYTDGS